MFYYFRTSASRDTVEHHVPENILDTFISYQSWIWRFCVNSTYASNCTASSYLNNTAQRTFTDVKWQTATLKPALLRSLNLIFFPSVTVQGQHTLHVSSSAHTKSLRWSSCLHVSVSTVSDGKKCVWFDVLKNNLEFKSYLGLFK